MTAGSSLHPDCAMKPGDTKSLIIFLMNEVLFEVTCSCYSRENGAISELKRDETANGKN